MHTLERISCTPDWPADTWIDRRLPAALRPYARLMRLDRPIGVWLLLFPCWWSVVLATDTLDKIPLAAALMGVFAVGAVVMRGAGCVINDLADHRLDRQVARTAARPLPSGAVSRLQALVFLLVLLGLGLGILLLLNPFARWVCLASLPFVVVYPFMKRVTWWPQFWLGVAFNWGALVGWAAVRGDLDFAPVVLHIGGVFWSLGYDTIYAHQDKEDDQRIGIKSTALYLGDRTRMWVFGFYTLTIVCVGLAGMMAGLSWWFFPVLLAAGGQLWWQAAVVNIHDPANCLSMFRSNQWFGWFCLAALGLGAL